LSDIFIFISIRFYFFAQELKFMADKLNMRLIKNTDAEATLEIYRVYVEKTAISFEYEVPALHEWQKRIETNTSEYPWLVGTCDGEIIGYAYGSKHRYRTAYMWSPESTIYLNEKFHGLGLAKVLYQSLFRLMAVQGFVNVYAGVATPNPKSENFHLSMGFSEIGIFRNVGYKFDKWHDTRWFQKQLTELPPKPSYPLKLQELKNRPEFSAIMAQANEQLTKLNPAI